MPNIGATIENKERRFLMGEKTNIQWTDATISPWDGCTKVGPVVITATRKLSQTSDSTSSNGALDNLAKSAKRLLEMP